MSDLDTDTAALATPEVPEELAEAVEKSIEATDKALEEAKEAKQATKQATRKPSPKKGKPRPKDARDKGALETLVKRILDGYITGVITPAEDEPMTPHRISRLVMAESKLAGGATDVTVKLTEEYGAEIVKQAQDKTWKADGTDGVKLVSAGAVTAMLQRWESFGFAVLGQDPMTFKGYTEEAVTEGLAKLKENHRAGLKQARKDAKAADKVEKAEAAAVVVEPEPVPVDPVPVDPEPVPMPMPDLPPVDPEPVPESGMATQGNPVSGMAVETPADDEPAPVVEDPDEPVTDPAFAPPASYQRPPAGTGHVPVDGPDDDMAGASHPDSGAPSAPVRSPFGTSVIRP